MNNYEAKERADWAPEIPEKFLSHYELGAYDEDRIAKISWKYLIRHNNMRRAWVRAWHHLPETFLANESFDILEFSTAHGAMLEMWRESGHNVVGTDYNWVTAGAKAMHKGIKKPWHRKLLNDVRTNTSANKVNDKIPGWPYQPIIESLGLDVRMVDGASYPYPFEDDSFDIVCCYQAIDAYTSPDKWLDVVHEFCRIARKTVLIGFNPISAKGSREVKSTLAAHTAWLEMQKFNASGFRADYFEIGQSRRGIHPVAYKLVTA